MVHKKPFFFYLLKLEMQKKLLSLRVVSITVLFFKTNYSKLIENKQQNKFELCEPGNVLLVSQVCKKRNTNQYCVD